MSQPNTTDAMELPLPDLPGIGAGWELLLPAEERARRCTGTTAARDEERRTAIIGACATLGTRRVAAAFGVCREVVRALRTEAIATGKLDQLKEQTGRRALSAADRVLDRIIDEVDELPRSSLAITYGILQDKGLLLTGQPTARVEHNVTVSHADLNAWIEDLPHAELVESSEESAQKGIPPARDQVPAIEAGEPGADESGDVQSPVSAQLHEGAEPMRAESGQNSHQKGGAA